MSEGTRRDGVGSLSVQEFPLVLDEQLLLAPDIDVSVLDVYKMLKIL